MPLSGYAQVGLESDQLLISKNFDVNYTFSVSHKDSSQLSPNKYRIKFSNQRDSLFLLFTIDEDQTIKRPITIKNNIGKKMAELYLENEIIRKRKLFSSETDLLEEEKIVIDDTIYTMDYNKYGKVQAEYREIDNKNVYHKQNSYNEQGLLLKSRVNNLLLGIYQQYNKGVLIEQELTKNLAGNMVSEKTYYTNEGEISGIVIKYKDGKLKEINSDGSFEITDGDNIKVYTKDKKPIRTYTIEYPIVD